jgi:hypothetical protein
MLGAAMRRRVLPLFLSLLLLITQQLGVLHMLSHVLHAGTPGATSLAQANGDGAPARAGAAADAHAHAAAGDALCQVCLVLATLVAAALPAVWRWRAPRPVPLAPAQPACAAPARRATAPYRARGPPTLPALV